MSILNSDGTQVDTQAKINAAVSGDTVKLPAAGDFTWLPETTMPASKFLTLDLNQSKVTLTGPTGGIILEAHATGLQRITNGKIHKQGTGYNWGPLQIKDAYGAGPIRTDNIVFTIIGADVASGTMIVALAKGPGIIDNCTFLNFGGAYEVVKFVGWGQVEPAPGWTSDTGASLAGSGNIFYMENCSFSGADVPSFATWIGMGAYGARVVIRYCNLDGVSIDMHGSQNLVGVRWWEIYGNTFDNHAAGQPTYACSHRAGSGVIHSNQMAPGAHHVVAIGLCEEDSVYPANYQIGRGLNNTSDPACVWNNGPILVAPNDQCDASEVVGMVQLGRDYVTTPRSGYTAYTYPHPLNTGSVSPGSSQSSSAHGAGLSNKLKLRKKRQIEEAYAEMARQMKR
jgi:hypothetical protein